MIDGGRLGVSRACQELPIRQIGNVLDWVKRDPAVFLASAVADSGRGLAQAIDDFVHGRLRTGVSVAYGLEQPDYVRLVVNAELSARFGPQIANWTARVSQGLVQVDTRYDGPEH
jgi:basic membrane protein A